MIPRFRAAGYFLAILVTVFLQACSPKQAASSMVDVRTTASPTGDSLSFAELSLKYSVSDSLAIRPSWSNYQYALQAMENQEWKLARRYLEKSLRHLVSERYDSLYSNIPAAEDSSYRLEMAVRLVLALDEVYPNEVTNQDSSQSFSQNDVSLDGFDDDAEDLADSAALSSLGNMVDSLDVNDFTLPVQFNDRVLQEIYYMTTKAKSFVQGSLSRKTAYDSLIYSKLEAHGVPRDLIYLSLVESGFKVKAYSRAKASGLWQFIPETGKRYGLNVDFWVDMRRNPEMATEAAIGYLSYLHNEFGDWLLAMAAYNCGEGRIRRIIREMKADSTRDTTQAITYWDLNLPNETMHYVPRILAAMVIGHYPEQYDIEVKRTYQPEFDTVTVFDSFSLEEIAKHLKVPEDTLRTLNMELVKWCTPPNATSYLLRLPVGTRNAFVSNYGKMKKNSFSSWHHHKVRKGETLGSIAKMYGISVSELKQANDMKNDRIRQGKSLLIPIKVNPQKSTGQKPSKIRTYTVQLGDNLAVIARKFGVSQESLRVWNSMDAAAVVKQGDTLFVSKPELAPSSEEKKISLKKGERYVVEAGDTYASIAQALDMPVGLLMDANGGFVKRLSVGDSLTIPAYTAPKKQKIMTSDKYGKDAVSTKNANKNESRKTDKKVTASLNSETYVVESGDNLYNISRKFSCSVNDLLAWNNLSNANIHPGQTLIVRGKPAKQQAQRTEASDGFIIYTVKQGDSMYDLAKSYKTTKEEIMKWNGLSDTKVKPGDKLKIKKP